MAQHLFNSRRSRFLAPKKFFIVATEGEKTEKIYLDEFKPPRGAMIQLTVIENKQHKTKPIACLERLKRYATKNFLGPEDELWLMIDRDSWNEAELDEVATEIAENPQFHLALSNPCFELWLYLHLADNKPFDHRDKLPPALAKILGRYDKAGYDEYKGTGQLSVSTSSPQPTSPAPKGRPVIAQSIALGMRRFFIKP